MRELRPAGHTSRAGREDPAIDVHAEFLTQWEANRRLTIRVALAFPGEQLMTYTPVATMRPFGVMLDEIARMEKAYLRGLAENVWKYDAGDPPPAKDAAGAITLLEASRAYTVSAWDRLTAEVLLTRRTDPFFFGADRRPYDWLFYCLENEIHHRGQAYTYLRQLGVEPPAFYER